MRIRVGLLLLGALLLPGRLEAQRCSKGKPCGNSCIARDKVCRKGQGSATWAPGADTVTGVAQQSARRAEPGDTGAVIPAARERRCIVARVIDGDTIECRGGTRVRFLLIDAPERDQGPFGVIATRGLQLLMDAGTELRLELDVQEYDRYRRLLAYAYLPDGRMVNELMVREGLAVVSVYPPNVKHVERMRAAAAEARNERRGLWSTSAFECVPADHRAGRC
jgi:endonuclease YncB( thermonuclease family)